jgi:hypothetical protein
MKRVMVGLIIIGSIALGGVLYGTHDFMIEEEKVLSLEQAYVAQYPQTLPDIMVDPAMDYVTAY